MEIEQLRRQRWTGVRIAQQLGLSHATVSRVPRRLKLNRIRHIEPQLPSRRYELAAPGDLLHLDISAWCASGGLPTASPASLSSGCSPITDLATKPTPSPAAAANSA